MDGETRKLVFANLVNGVAVPEVMRAFGLSEKETMDAFSFVVRKIRSYRLERGQKMLPLATPADARENKVDNLWALARINADTEPKFSRVETIPIDVSPVSGGMSLAEVKLFEMKVRAANGRR